MFSHAFYTWLAATLLYPVFGFCVAVFVPGQPRFFFDSDVVWVYVDILIRALPCSLPCLLAGWICLEVISRASFSVQTRFGAWLVMEVILTAIGAALLLGFHQLAEPQKLLLVLPGVMAVAAAILLRYKQFKKLMQVFTGPAYKPGMI